MQDMSALSAAAPAEEHASDDESPPPAPRAVVVQQNGGGDPAHSHAHGHHMCCEEVDPEHVHSAACGDEASASRPEMLPGDVVDLVPGMEDIYIVGTVDGFGKVTRIAGLDQMTSLKVCGVCSKTFHKHNTLLGQSLQSDGPIHNVCIEYALRSKFAAFQAQAQTPATHQLIAPDILLK